MKRETIEEISTVEIKRTEYKIRMRETGNKRKRD